MIDDTPPPDQPAAKSDAPSEPAFGATASKTGAETKEPDDLQKIVSSLPVDHSGTTVYVKGWCREGTDKPPIVIVHDLGEYTELYRDTAMRFIHAGYSVYIFDLRGHGRSGRRLGHSPSFNVLVKDLLQVAAWVRHKEGGRAPVILGHGIGALITIEFTKQHGNFCRAAVLSAPSLELTHEVSPIARFLIKVLAELSPTFRIPARLAPRFTKDLQFNHIAESGEEPRLSYFPRITAVFAQELLNAISRTEASFIEYHGDVLLLCPEEDATCGYAALRRSTALHKEHNLRLVDLPGVGHSVFTSDHEARDAAMGVILAWLDEVLLAEPSKRERDYSDIKLKGASKDPAQVAFAETSKPGASKI